MSRKLRKWLSLKDVAHNSGYTPRQLERILRRGPPKKLASYCPGELLAAMFHYAFRVERIKSGRVLRFKDTQQLKWICLFLKLHKIGVSPRQFWTAYYAQKLRRPRVDPFDFQAFLGMSLRRRASKHGDDHPIPSDARRARLSVPQQNALKAHPELFESWFADPRPAMLAVLAIDQSGFVPHEKFSDMAIEFVNQFNKAAKEKEKRESGEERQEQHWKEIAERDHRKESSKGHQRTSLLTL